MTDTPPSRPRAYSAPALEKAIDVIELLGTQPAGLSITEMAGHLGRSVGELFRIVVVLDQRGWLRKEPAGDRYRVTYKLLEAAHRATPAQELTHAAAPMMHALAASIEQSCHLVVDVGGEGLVVLRQESPGETGFAVRLGTAIPLADSCSGHVLLAFAKEPPARAAPALRERLAAVRAAGHERLASGRMAGVVDMSCPVFGFDGTLVAALTVPFLTAIDGKPHRSMDEALEELRATAMRVSTALGWYDRGTEAPVAVAAPRRRRAG